jgi:hypothetical protein
MKRKNIIALERIQEIKERYEPPIIEKVEVRVEYGFHASGLDSPDGEERNDGNFTW